MSSKEEESDELLYTVRSLVMVRNQLPAQVVKGRTLHSIRNHFYVSRDVSSRLFQDFVFRNFIGLIKKLIAHACVS